MKYKLLGEDLPKLYKHRQDPLFHYGDSWVLARGDRWVAWIKTCGEVRVYRNGDRISADDIPQYYKTDDALNRAEQTGELEIENNNWYEVQFFAERERGRGLIYLDLTSDLVAFSFDECLEQFKNLMADEKWCEDLTKYVSEVKGE